MEAARLRSSNVVVQSSCAALERALDGVFISLWLLVQRLEVQETYALKHLESLDRHPCVYVAPELKLLRALPGLGPGADPPVLLQLHSCHNLALQGAGLACASTSPGTTTGRCAAVPSSGEGEVRSCRGHIEKKENQIRRS